MLAWIYSLRSSVAPVKLYIITSATKPCKAQGCSFTVHCCWKLGRLSGCQAGPLTHPLVLTQILVVLLFQEAWHWLSSASRQPRIQRPLSSGWRERRLLCQPCQHSLRLGKLPPPLLPWLVCLPLNSRLIKMFYFF